MCTHLCSKPVNAWGALRSVSTRSVSLCFMIVAEAAAAAAKAERWRWLESLLEEGFPGCRDEAIATADMMVKNELSGFTNLRYAGDPGEWPGIEIVSPEVLAFLSEFCKKRPVRDRSRSRSASRRGI